MLGDPTPICQSLSSAFHGISVRGWTGVSSSLPGLVASSPDLPPYRLALPGCPEPWRVLQALLALNGWSISLWSFAPRAYSHAWVPSAPVVCALSRCLAGPQCPGRSPGVARAQPTRWWGCHQTWAIAGFLLGLHSLFWPSWGPGRVAAPDALARQQPTGLRLLCPAWATQCCQVLGVLPAWGKVPRSGVYLGGSLNLWAVGRFKMCPWVWAYLWVWRLLTRFGSVPRCGTQVWGCHLVKSYWKQWSAPEEVNPVLEEESDTTSHGMLAGHAVLSSWFFRQLAFPTGHPWEELGCFP